MRSMKKLIGLLLIAVIVFATLGVAYAETVSPMYVAVNDVQAMLEIESDGTANALVFVAPKQKGGIDYITVSASIVKKSTSTSVKTWKNIRVDVNPYTGKFVFSENYKLSTRGVYYLKVTSVKCYKDGNIVDTLGPLNSLNVLF